MSELTIAAEAARCAGRLLMKKYNQPHLVTYKGDIDIVTDMDHASERLVTGILREGFPGYGILGEEGTRSEVSHECCWIIDPLDGTTNYSHGYPLFGVSIALEKRGVITLGVVYNPVLDELFTAEIGKGAFLNDLAIQVSATSELGKSLLASGFPYDVRSTTRSNIPEWGRLIKTVVSARCDGSASLDLCHVACGRLDGYWELDLESWDMAAGALIVSEAGGQVSQANGEPFDHHRRNILATNAKLHQAMLEALRIL